MKRIWWRGPALGLLIFWSLAQYAWHFKIMRRSEGRLAQARWLQRLCRRALPVLGIDAQVAGTPPPRGLLVSNHLGYLDVLVLAALAPMVFVSKLEVRGWPVFGWLARCAGTLFLERNRKVAVGRLSREMTAVARDGLVVCLFPEGTSTDGNQVLPFHTSLLEPAIALGWPVTPAYIGFELADGRADREACYWGEMKLPAHALNFLGKKQLIARVLFGKGRPPGADRKELARLLRADVCGLGVDQREIAPRSDPINSCF